MKSFFKSIIVAILTFEAKLVLRKYHPKIIAITGSVGKTSTKDALYTVLATTFHVRKSQKSFNSEIGVPLTILGAPNPWSSIFGWIRTFGKGLGVLLFWRPYPEWLVLEVGVDRPGDIRHLTRWLTPNIVVVTSIPDVPVHVEYFDSPDELAEEKATLVDALADDGLLILNADDRRTCALSDRFRGQSVTYGFGRDAHVRAIQYKPFYKKGLPGIPEGVAVRVSIAGKTIPVEIHGGVGRTHVYPMLAATAFGAYCEIPLLTIAESFEHHETPPGRMRILAGIKNTAIIDDTYNSSPIAVEEALITLKELVPRGRRIAVFGDMLELGRFAVEAHKKLGTFAQSHTDMLVTVGLRARLIAEGALAAGMDEKNILQFDEAREAGKYLQNEVAPGDMILVKGSQSMRMERVVEEIMAYPERKTELLVRQDDEWLARP